jgi:APA family basic amino acid/polyamine antiporter
VVTFAGVIASLQLLIYTYDGWNGALYFSGEMETPGRDIPRSMFSGVISVIVIYLLLNAAFMHVMPLSRMAGDPLVADTASRLVIGAAGAALIRGLIAVSLLSAINAILLMASRILFAVGARRVNAGGTPTTALAVSTAVAIGFLLTGAFSRVAAFAAFFFVANYIASFLSVFRLRRTEPDTARPYRAWGYPFTTGIVLLGSIAFLAGVVITDLRNSIYAIVLLAASYPIHLMISGRLPKAPGEES